MSQKDTSRNFTPSISPPLPQCRSDRRLHRDQSLIEKLVNALNERNTSGSSGTGLQSVIPDFDPQAKSQTMKDWLGKINDAHVYGWSDRQIILLALPKLKGLAKRCRERFAIPQNVKSFPGCKKMHQVVWNLDTPAIAVRKLSCTDKTCLHHAIRCKHMKHLGFYYLKECQKNMTVTPLASSSRAEISQFFWGPLNEGDVRDDETHVTLDRIHSSRTGMITADVYTTQIEDKLQHVTLDRIHSSRTGMITADVYTTQIEDKLQHVTLDRIHSSRTGMITADVYTTQIEDKLQHVTLDRIHSSRTGITMPLTNAEKQRRYRERIKNCPEKCEIQRKKDLERVKHNRKKVTELNDAQKTKLREQWRNQKRRQRNKMATPDKTQTKTVVKQRINNRTDSDSCERTLQLRQIVSKGVGMLTYRNVSCFCGELKGLCDCFEIKTHRIRLNAEFKNNTNHKKSHTLKRHPDQAASSLVMKNTIKESVIDPNVDCATNKYDEDQNVLTIPGDTLREHQIFATIDAHQLPLIEDPTTLPQDATEKENIPLNDKPKSDCDATLNVSIYSLQHLNKCDCICEIKFYTKNRENSIPSHEKQPETSQKSGSPSILNSVESTPIRRAPAVNYQVSSINSGESEADLSDSDPTHRQNQDRRPRSPSTTSLSSATETIVEEPVTKKLSRKRKADPTKWKQNQQKIRRNLGEATLLLIAKNKSLPVK
ncbi:hypothetical protein ACJJTC_007682 [Scirpophaga incertulas]